MGKEIKLGLIYRDMWQSSGKYMPRVDQLVKVAEPIVDMGVFSRVETNGGGFEQICLLYGENPNIAVREWTTAFNKAGIETHMLERGLNGIRMSPVPLDVRRKMFELKKKQGTDIARSFDGLNYAPNLQKSFEYARVGGMVAQAGLCITYSEVHTVDYYIKLAEQVIELGAEEICIKDMAGIGRPVSIGKMIAGIRKRHPNIPITYHGHSTPGFSVASSLEAARAGADYIDVGMEPLSWGTGHADLLTVHAMLVDAGFSLLEINMNAYMEVRSLTQSFMDDFLGYYINPRNRKMNSLLIGPGLPGGMMGSLMADLENNLRSLNKWLSKRNKPNLTQDQLLIKLFDEVKYIWPKLGYPPLVTPYSQYVKNTALMNVIQMEKGRERWSMIDENTWGMILGRAGKLPGELGEEIKQLAQEQGREFFTGSPQDLLEDELDLYRSKMQEKGWELGTDEEELFEYAMHPPQYEDYKSGKAKAKFLEDLEQRKATESAKANPPVATTPAPTAPKTMYVDVDGERFKVSVSYDTESANTPQEETTKADIPATESTPSNAQDITSPLEGTFYLTMNSADSPVKIGDKIKPGQVIFYVESMKVMNAVKAETAGEVVEISVRNGDAVDEDDVIMKVV
jgi:pyruvate carboxylase subunit B